jgi:hypothetical protein
VEEINENWHDPVNRQEITEDLKMDLLANERSNSLLKKEIWATSYEKYVEITERNSGSI